MGKLFITLIIFLIVMQNIVAVRINEIEINPLKGRAGVEWIELYNEGSDINLAGWSIYDGLASSKKRYTFLDGATIKKHKYYVIELKSSVLNNNGDFVILYDKKNKLIDKTKTLKDLEGNSKTWQLCGKDWKFETETKGKKNKCKTKSAYHQEEQKIQYKKDNESFFNKTIKKSKIIKLNPKDIKTNKINNIINKRDYPFYGLILFSALLPILFILKFRKSKKNELR